MNHSPPTLSRPAIPSDVKAFAADKGVGGFLNSVIDLVQRAFPGSNVSVSIGQDVEDETHQYIAIDIESVDSRTDELLAGQRIWSAGLSRICPSRHAIYFVLGWR